MKRIKHAVHIVLGVAVGAALAVTVSNWQSRRERRASAPPAVAEQQRAEIESSKLAGVRTASTILSLAASRRRPATTPAAAEAASSIEQRAQVTRPTPEQQLADLRSRDQTLITRQNGERYDTRWAPATLKSITSGLEALRAGRHFTIESAECKTFTCSAYVRWADGTQANDDLHALVEYGYGLEDCARGLTLPKVSFIPGEPVIAPLVFDCANRRTDGTAAPRESRARG